MPDAFGNALGYSIAEGSGQTAGSTAASQQAQPPLEVQQQAMAAGYGPLTPEAAVRALSVNNSAAASVPIDTRTYATDIDDLRPGDSLANGYSMDADRTQFHQRGYQDTWRIVQGQIAEVDAIARQRAAEQSTNANDGYPIDPRDELRVGPTMERALMNARMGVMGSPANINANSPITPENLYTPAKSLIGDAFRTAMGEVRNPSNSALGKIVFGGMAAATAVPGFVNDIAAGTYNSPNDIYSGTQRMTVGVAMGDLSQFSAGLKQTGIGILGLAGIGGAAQSIYATEMAMARSQAVYSETRATYSAVTTERIFGRDIVADLGESQAKSFVEPIFSPVKPSLYYQAQRFGQTEAGSYFSSVKPANSFDAEVMGNIRAWGNNAEKIAIFEVAPGLNTWRGGVARGVGDQVYISKSLQSQYIRQIGQEPLFVDELKWINRR